MARENQGLQIALIISVVIICLLGVTTYMYFSKSERAASAVNSMQSQLQQEKQGHNQAVDDVQRLMEFVGHPLESKMEDVAAIFDEDMKMFASSWPEEERNYRNLPSFMIGVITDRSSKLTDASNTEKELREETEQVRKEESARVAKVEASRAEVAADLQSEQSKFNEDRTGFEQTTTELADTVEKKNAEVGRITDQRKQDVTKLEGLVTKSERLIDGLKERIRTIQEKRTGAPYAHIVDVNQRAKTAIIDLGEADGLRSLVNFTVYDPDVQEVEGVTPKGSIEVIRVLGENLAEARITKDELGEPLLRGDKIYSTIWRPGRRLRFALVGNLDLDADGKSDIVRLRNIIEASNGVVDVVLDEKGHREGVLSVGTRYVVIGEKPTLSGNDENEDSYSTAYVQLISEAQDLGIQRISLDELLIRVGWTGGDRVVHLDRDSRSEDFPPTSDEVVRRRSSGNTSGEIENSRVKERSTGNTSELFQPRSPVTRRRP